MAGWQRFWSEGWNETLYEGVVKQDNPLLYWRLGTPDGITDISGNGRNGTAEWLITIGGESGFLPTPDNDGATNFSGANQNISSSYNPFSGTKVFEGLFSRDTSTSHDALVSTSLAGAWIYLVENSNTFRVTLNSFGTVADWEGAWPGNNQEVHWAVRIIPGTTAELYINGASQGTRAVSAYGTVGNLVLGHDGSTGGFDAAPDGKMDEFAVYSDLSAARILYHAQLAGATVVQESGAAALSSETSLTTTANRIRRSTSTISGDTTLVPIARRNRTGAFALSSESALTSVPRTIKSGSTQLEGQSLLGGIALGLIFGASNLSGQSNQVSTPSRILREDIALSSESTLAASNIRLRKDQTALSSESSLQTIASTLFKSGSSLQAESLLGGIALSTKGGSAIFSSESTVVVVPGRLLKQGSNLSSQSNLQAAYIKQLFSGSNFSSESNLQSLPVSIFVGASDLRGEGTLAGIVRKTLIGLSNLEGQSSLQGTPNRIIKNSVNLGSESDLDLSTMLLLESSANLSAETVLIASFAGNPLVLAAIDLSSESSLSSSSIKQLLGDIDLSSESSVNSTANRLLSFSSSLSGQSNLSANYIRLLESVINISAESDIEADYLRIRKALANFDAASDCYVVTSEGDVKLASSILSSQSDLQSLVFLMRMGKVNFSSESNLAIQVKIPVSFGPNSQISTKQRSQVSLPTRKGIISTSKRKGKISVSRH